MFLGFIEMKVKEAVELLLKLDQECELLIPDGSDTSIIYSEVDSIYEREVVLRRIKTKCVVIE